MDVFYSGIIGLEKTDLLYGSLENENIWMLKKIEISNIAEETNLKLFYSDNLMFDETITLEGLGENNLATFDVDVNVSDYTLQGTSDILGTRLILYVEETPK
jgi:hypothetical protein